MRAQMSMSMRLTSHKKAVLWWIQDMLSKHAHSCLNLSERSDSGSCRNFWYMLASRLEPYLGIPVCTVCAAALKNIASDERRSQGKNSDSNEGRALWGHC